VHMHFYTNVTKHRNQILVRGYQNGRPYKKSVPYKPYLFIPTNKVTEYKNLKGEYVGRIDFSSMSEGREFLQKYEGVQGMNIYGLGDFTYLYIYDTFQGEVKYDPSIISVVSIDIEVSIDDGFPRVDTALNEVTAITMSRDGKKVVFGCGDYTEHQDNIKYFKCTDEAALLRVFLEIWNSEDYLPDVVTGWNIEFFDIPYLVNRIKNVLGEDYAKRLSPWNILEEYKVEIRGRENIAYTPVGVNVLDYQNLYKKFTYTQQESYRLDHIANVELGERKLDYSEYTGLQDMYNSNYQKYIEYNIRDVELIEKLEDKMKFIELVYALSYDAKVNYEDTLASVKQWDVIVHNYLRGKNIVIPQFEKNKNCKSLVGGYVKDPKVGLSKWVVSFDLNSLYPHLIMQYNISPETFVTKLKQTHTIEQILEGKISDYDEYLDKMNCAIAANLCVYSKERQGFLPALMQKMYNDRVVYKKQMIEVKKEYEKFKNPGLLKEIARLNNMQMAKKIQLNSAYGALGNQYFRWYDINHAEAITMSGQLSIRWIEGKLNKYLNKLFKTDGKDYVIASDTDSVYITLDKLVQEVMPNETDDKKIVKFIDSVCQKKLEPYIDSVYQELANYMHAAQQKMIMKREAIANKGIWKAKKMYILNVWDQEGVLYDKPKLKMMGIEAVRSSTPSSCRDNIKTSLDIIMNKSETELHAFIESFRQKFKTMEFEDIAFPRGVSDIEKWSTDRNALYDKGTPIHVKGAIIFNDLVVRKRLTNKYQSIASGEKVKFCYMKKPNPYGISVLSCPSGMPKEFGLEQYIDYDTQFDKAYIEPIKSIISTIGWNVEKTATLDDFFS
jgi:DNA polymerase elongation subunit (family B)